MAHRTMKPATCLVVGHRGFKGKLTENTLHGFQQCYDSGATIFETDVWASRDGVLVVSHDVNTKRVFCDADGNETDYNILETDFEVLKPLRTIGSGEPLMSFRDVLRWFVRCVEDTNGSSHRIMLDVKNANPPELLRLLCEDMLALHPALEWWFPRIQIGVWNLRFVKYLNQDDYFQRLFRERKTYRGHACFDIYHISLSWQSSVPFLAYNEYLDTLAKDRVKFKTTGVSLIYVSTWSPEFLEGFMPAVKKQNLNVYTWTVNRVSQLRYFCAVGRIWNLPEYGVITDHPDTMVKALSSASELWQKNDPQFSDRKQADQQQVVIPRSFMLLAWMARVLSYFANSSQPSGSPLFESRVPPHEKLYVKPKLGNKIFALLQAWGIF